MLHNLHDTSLGVRYGYFAEVEVARAIYHINLITFRQAQHTHTVLRFFFGELERGGNIGVVKAMHIE